ncbi:MAG: ligase-associated DNA damage response exonuclease [Cyclobacteriaceae bacterium]
MIVLNENGLFCPKAGLYIDPWKPVEKAVITHAHSDHARWGMKSYLSHHQSREILKYRLDEAINLETVPYGQVLRVNGVKISLHPAGHIPGSAQVRLEDGGEITVVSGDYKMEDDGLCDPFEAVKCHTFISESTFGLPIYKWEAQKSIFEDINQWWVSNAIESRCSVIFAYSLGKAQRILHNLNLDIGKVYTHGAIWNTNEALSANGLKLPGTERVTTETPKSSFRKAMILAPPSAMGSPWMRKFAPYRTALCSGWMNIRGARRRRGVDAGFVLSDHADWEGLNQAISSTGAENIYLTHGFTETLAKYLSEKHLNAFALETLYTGEGIDTGDE